MLFILFSALVLLLAIFGARLLLPTEPGWQLFPAWRGPLMAQNLAFWYAGRCYGRQDAYEAILSAAEVVRQRYPGSCIAYMDASRRHKGRLLAHRSHHNGMNIDVLFLGRDRRGQYFPRHPSFSEVGYFIKYDRRQRHGSLSFDGERNWAFLEGLRQNQALDVQMIFVEPYIKDWLIEAGRRTGATPESLAWARRVLCYAGDKAADHKDHFHIRFKE